MNEEIKPRSGISTGLIGFIYLACLLAGLLAIWFKPETPPESPTKKTEKESFFKLDLAKDSIGVIHLDGVIAMERRGFLSEDDTVERIRKNLEYLGKKKNVKAILFKINSPGGTVATSQEIYNLIKLAKQKYKKPLISLMGDVAASGGYYVASACDVIVASPGTLTGSIGVIFHTTQFDELAKKYGVQFNTIKSGKYKDIGSAVRPMLPDEKQLLQDLIDNAYGQFVQAVADGRKMDVEEVRKLADGRIYTGEQAASLKLIDSAGGLQDAIERAKSLGGIKGEPNFESSSDLKETLMKELFQGHSSSLRQLTNLVPPTGLLYLWTGF